MCRAICSPMAPSPITPVRFTASLILLILPCVHARTARRRGGLIYHAPARRFPDHHPVSLRRRRDRDIALPHVGEYARGIARERIAVAAAARRVEAKNVAGLQRIVRIARRQPLRPVGAGIDPYVAGAAVGAAREPVRRDHVLGRADREARLGEVEVLAPDAEPAAKLAG